MSITSTPLPIISLPTLSYSHFPPVLTRLPPLFDHVTPKASWRLFISPIPVSPSALTRHKTTERSIYNEARSFFPARSLKQALSSGYQCEILVVNHDGEMMEGTISTPYFWRRGRWVTPPASSGGNLGTTRRYALEAGLCVEETVTRHSITNGEAIWLSNGARGWGWGCIEMLEDSTENGEK